MKIRSKLLLVYGIVIFALFLVGIFSIWAVFGWSSAAEKLSYIHAQSLQAERFQANMYLQINYASDYLKGDNEAKFEFWNAQENALRFLDILKTNAKTIEEKDHITGLEETQFELVWIMNKFFESGIDKITRNNLPVAKERLVEIADEVADDVAALNQYFRFQENSWLDIANKAGSFAAVIIIISAILAIIQFILLAFLLERWLVRPIAAVNYAAQTISEGNLDVQIDMTSRDEWGQLSQAINKMVSALKASRRKLSSQEHLAALGEIAAYASHNIRNPLAGIRAAVQVLLNELDPDDTEMSESLTEIIKTVDRLDLWLKRLLEFARPLEIQSEPTDINELVTQAVTLAYSSYKQCAVQLEWKLAKNLPKVEVDPILLEQALVAIAVNAVQAVSENGSIKVETALMINNDNASRIAIRISDNGKGVPEHIQPKLFKVFVSSKDDGTGLGLAQAKKIVDIHNGEIFLESLPGKGTSIIISIPLQANLN